MRRETIKCLILSSLMTVLLVLVEAENFVWGNYSQDDYDIAMERGEIWVNPLYITDIRGGLVFLNRTQKAVNGTGRLLVDLTDDVKVDVQFYKFTSNEYRFFPITISVDPCKEFRRNSFNVQEITNRVSNFRTCPTKKGFYYVRNYVPDFSKAPPYMVRGAYKVVLKGYWKSELAGELHAFGTVKEKPLKWKK